MNTPPDPNRTPEAAARSHEHPGAPKQHTSLSHVVDTVSFVGYFAAIGVAALFLDVPYPWAVAGVISLACLLAIGSGRKAVGGSR